MMPKLVITSEIDKSNPLVYLIGGTNVPASINLGKDEEAFVTRMLTGKRKHVTLNLFPGQIHFVSIDRGEERSRLLEELRKSANALKDEIGASHGGGVTIISIDENWDELEAFAEGLILATYTFDKYKTSHSKPKEINYPEEISLYGNWNKQKVANLSSKCEAVYFARDLVNEPVSYLNAEMLASEIEAEGQKAGFTVDIFNKGKIETLRMGGLLAVNKGSVDPPVFCVLEWNPAKAINKKPIVLVGKGVTYDTGGLNLKTGDYMDQMKGDMAGAAAVSAIISIMARTSTPLHVIGLVPATDNRPGGNAFVQGDVVTMYNGLTVEIVNTDAEGRMILADALAYSEKYSPALVMDLATLTGSAQMTFGKEAIAVMGNAPDSLFDLLAKSGDETFERVGRLPFWDEYSVQLESSIADIRNLGKREAGAITAGKFLERFAPKPYIHLDIAGTAILKKDDHYRLKEGTASGVRLVSQFLTHIAEGEININDL